MTEHKYGELLSAVSHSARLVAGLRAVESEEGPRVALFDDPLAGVLAGDEVVQQARDYAMLWPGQEAGETSTELPPEEQRRLGRKRKAGRLAVRTWWFDHRIPAALNGKFSGGTGSSPEQVVLLGAGMDTRAWRQLGFPADVRWFEVDRADVTQAKDRALAAVGAQTTELHATNGDPGSTTSGSHPLRVGSRVTLEADLAQRGWADKLRAAGWDPKVATVWVAEGLLMYLEASAVALLLEEASGASAEGSVLVTMAFGEGYSKPSVYSKTGPFKELQASYRWMCGPDIASFMAEHGWKVVEQASYSRMAAETGLPTEAFTLDTAAGSFHDEQTPFIVASLA